MNTLIEVRSPIRGALSVMVNRGVTLREPNWFPYSKKMYESLRIYLHMFFSDKNRVATLKGLLGNIRYFRKAQKEATHGT